MRRMWSSLAALLLVCALVIAGPGLTGAARAAGGAGAYELTVGLVADGTGEEPLTGAAVDLYQVARTEDGIWRPVGAFSGLPVSEDAGDPDAWDAFAQEAARLALPEGAEPPVPDQTAEAAGNTARFAGLEAGLYLLLAHGAGAEDYAVELGDGRLGTVIESGASRYTFLPQMVAVPAEGEALMKPAEEPELGELEIEKTLNRYVDGQPGTFAFEVEATLDGVNVYSDVVSVTFTEAGTQSVLVEGIPVGAEVTVTEVYSGASYYLTSEPVQTAVVGPEGEETAGVRFTNDAEDGNRGGSATNRFTYEEDQGWAWVSVPDTP